MYIEPLLSLAFGMVFILVGIYKKDYTIYIIGGILSILIGLLISVKVFPLYFCFLSLVVGFGLLTIRGFIVNRKKRS